MKNFGIPTHLGPLERARILDDGQSLVVIE
jgi:hypothetical protein